MSKKITILMCCIILLHVPIPGLQITGFCQMKVGVASVDITPTESIMLNGYAARTEPSKGVVHSIYARAMAFEDSTGKRAVLVATDLIGFFHDLSEKLADRVNKELNIPRECLMLTSSHTHTAPLLYKSKLSMYDLSDQQINTIADYTEKLKENLFRVIQESLSKLAPMALSFGRGEAHFGINRRSFRANRVAIGVNPDGPLDNQVPVLAVSDTEGNHKAVLFGYACHGTTLKKDDYYNVCGDYMGFAREYLDLSQPGITSLFVAGCGADINPYPRGTLKLARLHGLQLAGTIADVIRLDRAPVNGLLRCSFKIAELPYAKIPSEAEFRERLNSENPHIRRHANYFLGILERGDKIPSTYPYPIQVWQFDDDLTIVALGGEVVVDYALRLKRELGIDNLWTIAFANDVCGYIGSARTLYEGGYEADDSTIYYTLPTRWDFSVEEIIISTIKEMVGL